ncbi:COMM domain-containing protein 8 isoform X2 [Loxodonta africana]|uniref:COMM domain-containing protein 8 isoform X2 n=1 Tax=Loxodonta africana TaxID=9785 RepID=UPI000C812C36|nr:COMM domain-containing protein 8 isoform X2 [Loxodonta africana]
MESEEGTPLWQLQKLPTELGPQLLHKIIDGICGRAYPLYQDYHSVWDSTEWVHILEDTATFFKVIVGKNLSDEEISQQLNQLNSFHQEAIMKCLKSRKDEIRQALLGEIVDISSAQLQDFDWQLKPITVMNQMKQNKLSRGNVNRGFFYLDKANYRFKR